MTWSTISWLLFLLTFLVYFLPLVVELRNQLKVDSRFSSQEVDERPPASTWVHSWFSISLTFKSLLWCNNWHYYDKHQKQFIVQNWLHYNSPENYTENLWFNTQARHFTWSTEMFQTMGLQLFTLTLRSDCGMTTIGKIFKRLSICYQSQLASNWD